MAKAFFLAPTSEHSRRFLKGTEPLQVSAGVGRCSASADPKGTALEAWLSAGQCGEAGASHTRFITPAPQQALSPTREME